MKNIIGVCTLLLLFLCGCSAEDSMQQELPEGAIGVRLIAWEWQKEKLPILNQL